MPYKNKEYRLEKARKYCQNNLEKIKAYKKEYRKKRKQYIDEYKLSKGCAICGYNKCAGVLEFHHNGVKVFNVSSTMNRSLKRLKEEIKKCVILCANCHRELHDKNTA